MQAIHTKWLRPVHNRSACYVATAAAGRMIVEAGNVGHERGHVAAAEAFRDKMGWNADEGYGALVSGCLPDGSYAHTMAGRDGRGDVS